MITQPTLRTNRLLLRPITLADAPDIRTYAGDREVASTTINIPHPYEEGMAEAWIATLAEGFERGENATFGIVQSEMGQLIGAAGLRITAAHRRAEIGYWIGKPYWGNGYCSEAAGALLEYAFTAWALTRVNAHHMTRNPASGRVMQKLGMRHEGRLRKHFLKWNVLEDVEVYGILKEEWLEMRQAGKAETP